MGNDNAKVQCINKTDTIQYLGVWFSTNKSKAHNLIIAQDEISKITRTLQGKKLTNQQDIYINNRILIPRLEYRLSTFLIPETVARKIYTPMIKLSKQLMNLPCTAQTNVITHTGILGLKTLWQNQLEHHIHEFVTRL